MRKMLYEAESKHKILEYNINLFQENKKLLQEKLDILIKLETPQKPTVDKNCEDKENVKINIEQHKPSISEQTVSIIQGDTKIPNLQINNKKLSNLED